MEDESKTRAYTDDEMEQLTKTLKNFQGSAVQKIRAEMLIVVMWQFLRIGEAIELRVKDVDLEADVLHIRRQYDEIHHKVALPKDDSRRDVPLSGHCRKVLEDACQGKGPDDLVFEGDRKNAHGGRMLRSATLDTLSKACKVASVERHIVHDLRHDGISYLVRKGVQPISVMRWAGHKDLTVTLNVYFRQTGEDDPRDRALMAG